MELAPLDIDIAALSEVGFAERGSLTKDRAGYTLFWSLKNKDEHRLSGVGPNDQKVHCQKIAELASRSFRPHYVPKTPNPGQQVATVLSVYALSLIHI